VAQGRLLILGTWALAATAGRGSSSTPTLPIATTCGIPYTFSASGHAPVQSGSCAGLILPSVRSLTVHEGQRLSVEIVHEQNGRLDFPIPTPTTRAVRIVSTSGAIVTYQAVSAGTVKLLAHHARLCAASDPSCGGPESVRTMASAAAPQRAHGAVRTAHRRPVYGFSVAQT